MRTGRVVNRGETTLPDSRLKRHLASTEQLPGPDTSPKPARLGLAAPEIPLALFSFNLGIELGQLAFVAAVLLVAAALRGLPVAWPRWAKAALPYGIGAMATFWFLQRAVSLM